MSERVGFVGLGIMGRGMANNLLTAGFPLRVWNRTASRMDPFVEAGAEAGESPADVAANSDIIPFAEARAIEYPSPRGGGHDTEIADRMA